MAQLLKIYVVLKLYVAILVKNIIDGSKFTRDSQGNYPNTFTTNGFFSTIYSIS